MGRNNIKWYSDSLSFWEKINEAFLIADENLNFVCKGRATYLYDYVVGIKKPKLDSKNELPSRPVIEVTRKVDPKVKLQLFVLAGGRCQFDPL